MRAGPPFGFRMVHVAETGSTMDDLRELAHLGAGEGTVVRADVQATGRGRGGRAWVSPPGGLWFSVLLRPEAPRERWGLLPLVLGVGVAQTLRARGAPAEVKWPNDVILGGRKVGGLLCESRVGDGEGFVVAGFGINANVDVARLPEDVQRVATSLLPLGGPHDLSALLRDALAAIESRYRAFESGGVAELLAEYRALSCTLGRRVATAAGLKGVAVDVLENGTLVVETDAGQRVGVVADEVHIGAPPA